MSHRVVERKPGELWKLSEPRPVRCVLDHWDHGQAQTGSWLLTSSMFSCTEGDEIEVSQYLMGISSVFMQSQLLSVVLFILY